MFKLSITLLFFLFLSGVANAISNGDIPKNSTNNSDLTIKKEVKPNPGKVRIGLKLSPFSKVQLQDQSGKKHIKFKPDAEIKRTLRARIDMPNHFVVENYHVESIPLKWIRKTQSYAVRLSFSKRYGEYGEVEEHLGTIDVAGRLSGKDGVYILMGASAKTIKNDRDEPLLKIVAGYGSVGNKDGIISKSKPTNKAGLRLNKKEKTYSTFKPRRSSNKIF